MTAQSGDVPFERVGVTNKAILAGAPLAAIGYPWALQRFNANAAGIFEPGHRADALVWFGAGFFLMLAFAVPAAGLFAAIRLAREGKTSKARERAKLVALLVVAAPPVYTFLGVIGYMANIPVPEEWVLAGIWTLLILIIVLSSDTEGPAPASKPEPGTLRLAHGMMACVIVCMFLAFHIFNHLAGLMGADAHKSVMKTIRLVYGSSPAESVLVALFVVQILTGLYLAQRRLRTPADGFRTFQIASGIYLAFFIAGHMNTIFIYARTWSDPPIVTDWAFATSEAWGGLVKSAWSNRLIPHYMLGVFFVLAHIGAGVRVIMLGHGFKEGAANRTMFAVTAMAFAVAQAIILGMLGVRLNI